MTTTGTGAGELRERAIEVATKALMDKYKVGEFHRKACRADAETMLAAIAEAGLVLTPAGGLTATPDVRAAIARMVDGTDTGDDRNVVRRWLGR